MHTEAYQFSVPTLLNPTQRLFRSLDGNADGQITAYEIKTSGIPLPNDPVAATSKSASDDDVPRDQAPKGGDQARETFSSSASRFQYFLAMMTQVAEKPAANAAPAPKPVETNPYLKTGEQPAAGTDTSV